MVKKILVPLDGSEFAENALAYAENLALKYDAELFLVRSLQPMLIVSEHVTMPFYSPRLCDEQGEARTYLKSVQHKLHLPTHIAVLEGRPIADAIVEMATQEIISLIVMTTHGRSGFRRWIAGSIADEVVKSAPCPVFLVRGNEPKH